MKHYIIVKFSETVQEKAALYPEIETLFKKAEKIEGIHRVSFYPSVIDLPNRYDFMILLEMERGAPLIFTATGNQSTAACFQRRRSLTVTEPRKDGESSAR